MRPASAAVFALTFSAVLTALPTPGHAGSYSQFYAFQGGTDGANPVAALINQGGLLYGTTERGGASGIGTVFALNPATGANQTIHAFGGTEADGWFPTAGPTLVGGILYGTTSGGGAAERGTVYSLDPATGAEQILVNFTRKKRGAVPNAGLTLLHGKLFGALAYLGAYNAGALFSLNLNTGAEKDIHDFQGADGNDPGSTLIAIGGTLYGTTNFGGGGAGTVFSINAKTNAETVLYAFQGGNDGAGPLGGLLASGGMLYGTTQAGGPANAGTVYAINPANGAKTTLYSFLGGNDGANPDATLIKYAGRLYGVTYHGGKSTVCGQGCGTIYAVSPVTGRETTLYSFQGRADGAAPQAALINVNFTLYGTTSSGGSANCNGGCGTVFAYTP